MWRVIVWMWLTQRNGKGPLKYFGAALIEWVLWAALIACAVVGYWLLFKLLITMSYFFYR